MDKAKKIVFNAASRCGKDVSMEDLEWYLKNRTMEENLSAINEKIGHSIFSYDLRKWYGPLHRYNRLITIRNHRVELGLRLSYGK